MTVEMKLKEVCEKYGISRRAIQGYESMGLVEPYRRTQFGHLVYDYEAIRKIVFIKYCQDIGLLLKEIAIVIDLDQKAIAEVLKKRTKHLESRINELNELTSKTQRIISALSEENDAQDQIYQIITGEEK